MDKFEPDDVVDGDGDQLAAGLRRSQLVWRKIQSQLPVLKALTGKGEGAALQPQAQKVVWEDGEGGGLSKQHAAVLFRFWVRVKYHVGIHSPLLPSHCAALFILSNFLI